MRVAAVLILTATLAAPWALPPSDASTNVTFTLVAGTLSVTEPSSVNLGAATSSSLGASLTGRLGVTTVSDQRGALSAWTATIATTDFTDGATPTAHTISAGKLKAYIAPGDGPTVTSGIAVPATTHTTVATALPLSTTGQSFVTATTTGSNTVTYNPTIVVTLDSTVVAGTYTGTITQSVS